MHTLGMIALALCGIIVLGLAVAEMRGHFPNRHADVDQLVAARRAADRKTGALIASLNFRQDVREHLGIEP